MTCLEAQSLITKYVNDEINGDTLELFIRHINNCADCKEELEVYYMLLTGMKQLDEDKILSSDFHIGFLNKLKKSEEKIFQRKFHEVRRRILLYVAILCVPLFLVRSNDFYEKDVEVQEEVDKTNNELDQYYNSNRIEFERYIENYVKPHIEKHAR